LLMMYTRSQYEKLLGIADEYSNGSICNDVFDFGLNH